MTGPVIIDVSGVVCRAFFAEQSLAEREGRPFLPMHQLVNMVASLGKQFQLAPGAPAAAVLDPRGRTWRHDPMRGGSWDYKSKRKPKPELLSLLLNETPALFRAFGWPTLCRDGYEADDVICSLAHQTRGAIVVSVDKDFMQFMGARTGLPYGALPDLENGCRIWSPMKDPEGAPPGTRGDWLDWNDLWKKFAVDPRTTPATKIVEIQALMGDTVDCIPGVRGLGTKAAKLLIAEYGTAEATIAAAKNGPLPKHVPQYRANRQRLLEQADNVRLSWRLARLLPDLDVTAGVMGHYDDAAVQQLLSRWEPVAPAERQQNSQLAAAW